MTCLHKKFLQDHPDNTISFAQFCKLRPFWITAPKSSERETCACKIHENFKFKVMKLHQSGITPMKTPTDVVARTVCAISNKLCMYGQCTDCTQKKKPDLNLDPSTKNNTVTFEEWMTRTVPITRKNQDGSSYEVEMRSTVLDKRSTTIEKLVEMVYDDLPKFCIHIYNISHQFERLHYLKNTLTNAETVIHIDYSENYACKYATEIQDMHFAPGKQQVSLHTGVRYLSGGRVECFCSVSSCVRHDACATWAHLEPVLKKLRDEHPEVNTIHFMSDGPTSQYRNKTNFYLTSSVPFLMGFQHVTWNFSEASHGKGAPDGIEKEQFEVDAMYSAGPHYHAHHHCPPVSERSPRDSQVCQTSPLDIPLHLFLSDYRRRVPCCVTDVRGSLTKMLSAECLRDVVQDMTVAMTVCILSKCSIQPLLCLLYLSEI
ncbi:uncharacterized protein LOC134438636 [Engraulis encrasicolus]|uniref:uncharacterized protein LOC134438636 n=1 Tax=Engraulis encrasicolus TaxID=184585 RepID=UPI002FD6ACBE